MSKLSGSILVAVALLVPVLNGGSPERFRTDANQLFNPNALVAQNLQPPRVGQVSLRFQF